MLPINQPPPAAAVLPDDVPQPVPVAAHVQAQVQVEANELSLDVCKWYLCTPSPRVPFQLTVFMCLPCFSFAGVFSSFVLSLCGLFRVLNLVQICYAFGFAILFFGFP